MVTSVFKNVFCDANILSNRSKWRDTILSCFDGVSNVKCLENKFASQGTSPLPEALYRNFWNSVKSMRSSYVNPFASKMIDCFISVVLVNKDIFKVIDERKVLIGFNSYQERLYPLFRQRPQGILSSKERESWSCESIVECRRRRRKVDSTCWLPRENWLPICMRISSSSFSN